MSGAVVVAGVSGAGKSTVARAVADGIGFRFVDADDLHPAANVMKMASGLPLGDPDRLPWLDIVGKILRDGESGGVVVACSALRRSYRDRLRQHCPALTTLLLRPSVAELERRLAVRRNHFMPPALLASQIATLEPLEADEAGVEIAEDLPLEELIAHVTTVLTRTQATSPGTESRCVDRRTASRGSS